MAALGGLIRVTLAKENMTDNTIYRTPQENPPTAPPPKDIPIEDQVTVPQEEQVEVPYFDYHKEHGKPFTVEHYKLGDSWQDAVGGFPKEVGLIEEYISKKITSGEVANSVSAVKDLLKGIEKMTGVALKEDPKLIDREERTVVKLEKLAAYVEFLMKNENLKNNLRRYHG